MIHVEGLPELSAKLTDLGVVKIPMAMRKVTVAGAKPLRAAIKTAAVSMFVGQSETDPGGMVRGIRYKQVRGSKGMEYVIGPFGHGTRHRGLVIQGHEIRGHNRSRITIGGHGFGTLAGSSSGKRTRPVPFVEVGRQAAQGAALSAIEVAASVAVEEAAKL